MLQVAAPPDLAAMVDASARSEFGILQPLQARAPTPPRERCGPSDEGAPPAGDDACADVRATAADAAASGGGASASRPDERRSDERRPDAPARDAAVGESPALARLRRARQAHLDRLRRQRIGRFALCGTVGLMRTRRRPADGNGSLKAAAEEEPPRGAADDAPPPPDARASPDTASAAIALAVLDHVLVQVAHDVDDSPGLPT